MRIVFSCVPAYGHLLPMAPLVRAAAAAGHEPAILTSAAMASAVQTELPGVLHLQAGQSLLTFSTMTAERLDEPLSSFSLRFFVENFGGTRLDDAADTATDRARAFAPDLVIAEMFDTVGPLVASALHVPWHGFGLGPAFPDELLTALAAVTTPRYAARSLEPLPSRSYIDIWPRDLQTPGWRSPVTHHPMTQRAHHRPSADEPLPSFADPSKPQVLVTLGTLFSTPVLLEAALEAVVSDDVNVLATSGFSITDESMIRAEDAGGAQPGNVRIVRFAPLDQLLEHTEVVVSVGGAGTVVGAISQGVPMVLWPQGAGHGRMTLLWHAAESAGGSANQRPWGDLAVNVSVRSLVRDTPAAGWSSTGVLEQGVGRARRRRARRDLGWALKKSRDTRGAQSNTITVSWTASTMGNSVCRAGSGAELSPLKTIPKAWEAVAGRRAQGCPVGNCQTRIAVRMNSGTCTDREVVRIVSTARLTAPLS